MEEIKETVKWSQDALILVGYEEFFQEEVGALQQEYRSWRVVFERGLVLKYTNVS